jgi:hypothetical protein
MLCWLMNMGFAGGGGTVTPPAATTEYRVRFRVRRGR